MSVVRHSSGSPSQTCYSLISVQPSARPFATRGIPELMHCKFLSIMNWLGRIKGLNVEHTLRKNVRDPEVVQTLMNLKQAITRDWGIPDAQAMEPQKDQYKQVQRQLWHRVMYLGNVIEHLYQIKWNMQTSGSGTKHISSHKASFKYLCINIYIFKIIITSVMASFCLKQCMKVFDSFLINW